MSDAKPTGFGVYQKVRGQPWKLLARRATRDAAVLRLADLIDRGGLSGTLTVAPLARPPRDRKRPTRTRPDRPEGGPSNDPQVRTAIEKAVEAARKRLRAMGDRCPARLRKILDQMDREDAEPAKAEQPAKALHKDGGSA